MSDAAKGHRIETLHADMKRAIASVADGKPMDEVMSALMMTMCYVAVLSTPSDFGYTGLGLVIGYLEGCQAKAQRIAALLAHEPGRVEA